MAMRVGFSNQTILVGSQAVTNLIIMLATRFRGRLSWGQQMQELETSSASEPVIFVALLLLQLAVIWRLAAAIDSLDGRKLQACLQRRRLHTTRTPSLNMEATTHMPLAPIDDRVARPNRGLAALLSHCLGARHE
jgi:hypothetical protein